MSIFYYKNRGHGMPYAAPHDAAFMLHIDIPDMIANQPFTATLPSTGFAAADVLHIFDVPAGFLLRTVGVRVTTAEGGACTADLGNVSATETHLLGTAPVGFMGTIDLNSEVTQTTLVADTDIGGNTTEGAVFVTDGTIELTFVTAATAVAVFDVWACGWKVF